MHLPLPKEGAHAKRGRVGTRVQREVGAAEVGGNFKHRNRESCGRVQRNIVEYERMACTGSTLTLFFSFTSLKCVNKIGTYQKDSDIGLEKMPLAKW